MHHGFQSPAVCNFRINPKVRAPTTTINRTVASKTGQGQRNLQIDESVTSVSDTVTGATGTNAKTSQLFLHRVIRKVAFGIEMRTPFPADVHTKIPNRRMGHIVEFDDPEIIQEFVVESAEHLADIENQLLSIEASGADIDSDLVNTVFRGVHSIKGAAGFLGLTTINRLAHSLENVLNLMREGLLVPTSAIVDVMLRAADELTRLIENATESNEVNVDQFVAELDAITSGSEDEQPETVVADSLAEAEALIAAAAQDSKSEVTLPATPPAQVLPDPPPEASSKAPAVPEQAPAVREQAPAAKKSKPTTKSSSDSNIRVSVESLDHLMNLAGELVLGRNQLLQTIAVGETKALEAAAAKINQVTCEMQDAIMQTRMQPIGNVFNRFTRVVRDLSTKLGKECQLVIEGKQVEVDKTIVEAIADPLTHLVRNAVDHGMELPSDREAASKPRQGVLQLRAFHQSGKVCVEIKDDGGGINADVIKRKAIDKGMITEDEAEQLHPRDVFRLIFMPGFSTAEQVSDVSGRGVGMDVVRTNIERIGGAVEIDSELGVGTTITVTLPLTLAIIPSLIVHCSDDRFAVPQVNIVELVRIRRSEVATRIGRVRDAEVLRLRGNLLPLIRLRDALDMSGEAPDNEPTIDKAGKHLDEAMNIIVVETGQHQYGLVVDGLFDSEEIVVKPLGRHLKECHCLSGATILGDGRVALILDISGIGQHMAMGTTADASKRPGVDDQDDSSLQGDQQSLLLFNNDPNEQFAIPMGVVSRIERIQADQVIRVGDQLLLQDADTSLPLICLEDHLSAKPREERPRMFVVVFEASGKEIGLLTPILHDVRNVTSVIDELMLREPGVIGTTVIDGVTTRLIDVHELVMDAHPDWFPEPVASDSGEVAGNRILLVEDSKFFRTQVRKHLQQHGYEVTEAEDGQFGWDAVLADPNSFDLVVTDIQMPRMNGFELCDQIKGDARTSHLPVIALTSLAGDEDMKRGRLCGVDEYQVKMDREKLLAAVRMLVLKRDRSGAPIASLDSTSPAGATAQLSC